MRFFRCEQLERHEAIPTTPVARRSLKYLGLEHIRPRQPERMGSRIDRQRIIGPAFRCRAAEMSDSSEAATVWWACQILFLLRSSEVSDQQLPSRQPNRFGAQSGGE